MNRAINLVLLALSVLALVLLGALVRDHAESWGYVQITLAQLANACSGFCAIRACLYLLED